MPAGPGQHLHDQIRLHSCVRLALRPPLPHRRRTAQGLTDTSRENRLQARGHPGRPALVPRRKDQMVRSEPGTGAPLPRRDRAAPGRAWAFGPSDKPRPGPAGEGSGGRRGVVDAEAPEGLIAASSEHAEGGVRPTVCAGPDPVGEQGAGLVAVDDPAPLARGVAVAGVDLGRGLPWPMPSSTIQSGAGGRRFSARLRSSSCCSAAVMAARTCPIQMVSCCSRVRSRGRSGGKSYMCSTLRRGAEWMRRTA